MADRVCRRGSELVGSRLQREAAPSVLFSRREANLGPEARTAVLAIPAGGCRRDRHSHCGWLLGATKRSFRDCKVPAAAIARHTHGERRSAPDATSRAARFLSRFGWGGDKNSAWGAARSGGKRNGKAWIGAAPVIEEELAVTCPVSNEARERGRRGRARCGLVVEPNKDISWGEACDVAREMD